MSEKKTFHNIIGGEVQASADGAMMDIVNRRPGEVYASAPNSSAVDVDQACQAAGAAFEKSKSVWRFVTGFWRAHRHPIAAAASNDDDRPRLRHRCDAEIDERDRVRACPVVQRPGGLRGRSS